MKVEILKENLRSGLGVVEKNIGKNLSLPVLNNVLVRTEESFIHLTSTNLETTIQFWVLAKIIKRGTLLLPARFLGQVVASLPNDKITMEAAGNNIKIECKNIITQIQGFDAEEFPIIPEFKQEGSLQIASRKLFEGLSQVAEMAAPSQTRPEISGIYFSFNKNNITMAATDSFRLSEKHIISENPLEKEYAFILPQNAAREVMAILQDKDAPVTIQFSQNQVSFELPMLETKHPHVTIVSRLIEGEYPQYQEIIPQKFKTNVVVQKDEFLNQIKAASLFSGKVNEVKISINPEKKEVEISAKNPDGGTYDSHMPCQIKGEALQVSFNYKFLVDGLNNIKSSEITFDISKEEGPCLLRPVGDASYLYVVMPIKSI